MKQAVELTAHFSSAKQLKGTQNTFVHTCLLTLSQQHSEGVLGMNGHHLGSLLVIHNRVTRSPCVLLVVHSRVTLFSCPLLVVHSRVTW